MKFLKTKVAMVIIAASLLLTGANVYAVTALDKNIVELIRSGISQVANFFDNQAEKEVEQLAVQKQKDLSGFVDQRTDQVLNDLEKAKSDEVARAKSELDAYYNELTSQTDAAIATEKTKAKSQIKQTVNAEIEQAKTDLSKELEKKIKNKMNELPKHNNGNGKQ